MSKLHLSLFLLCLSIAVCSAAVLPRASNELQNEILTLEVAHEKDVSELGKNGDKMLEDGNKEKKHLEPKTTDSSLNVSESGTAKIEEVLNITNAFSHSDGAGQDKETSMEGASQISPVKLSSDSDSQTNELKDGEHSDFKTSNLESISKSTSDKISNETEGIEGPLKEILNETDNTQVSRSHTNNPELLLLTEEIELNQGDKSVVSEILDANFSLLPNETIEFDNANNTGNSSSIRELEIFLNETEINFNNTEFIELSINITGDGEELFSNFSTVIKTDNSSDLINETEAFRNANFSGNFSSFEEHNASSVVFSNETGTNLSDKLNSLEKHNSSFTAFSNDTENLSNISFENITDIDVGNVTSLSFLNVTDVQDNTEGDVNNSEEMEQDSFTLNETEASSIDTEIMSDNENLKVESDVENTPIEGLSPVIDEKESEGLFSNFGFDFLKNSQIAKNAAKAMEIFNLSDSITDHIIEEHEFHSFLDAAPGSADSVDAIAPVKLPQEQIDPAIFNVNGSPEGLKTLEETGANASEDATSLVNEISDIEGVTLLNETVLSDNVDSSSNLTKPDNITDEANLPSNSSESTAGFNETLPQVTNSSVPSFPDVKVNSTTASPKCPPPGVCIFWFLAQDTCALNSHCLGTRICCKIRCSKTCIEV